MRKAPYVILAAAALLVTGCSSEADVALDNNVNAAENFEIQRRIVFINGITDTYLLEIEGRCSYEADGVTVQVVCKTGEDADGQTLIMRHTMVRSDNVTVVVEQLEAEPVDTYHYRLNFRPEVIAPYIDLETSVDVEQDG